MALSKLGSRGIVDCSVLAADFAPGTITAAKLAGSIENSKLANSSITIGGQAISLGGSDNALNLVDWQSKITSDGSTVMTMVSGRGYFVDNSSAAGLVKLPASASIGDYVVIKDYAGNFGTNNLTIQRNSHNIQGIAGNSTISTNRASVVLVYVDSTKGWLFTDEHNVANLAKPVFTEATGGTITTSGNFKIHTFTGDGCFVASQIGNSPIVPTGGPVNVDYLVVAGGGGGHNGSPASRGGGAGGAGGLRTTFPSPSCNAGAFPISVQTYPITVGGGGPASPGPTPGRKGSNSIFSTITSTGGGAGGSAYMDSPTSPGDLTGGSGGGGGGSNACASVGSGGAGNTPPVSPSQGNNGGAGGAQNGNNRGGGGGGGGGIGGGGSNGGDAGPPGASVSGGSGGAGSANSITGSSVTYAAGGTGGGNHNQTSGTAGTTNRGNGGGGGGGVACGPAPIGSGATGGSGIVIIRYKYQ